jgi:hypothetical protein
MKHPLALITGSLTYGKSRRKPAKRAKGQESA